MGLLLWVSQVFLQNSEATDLITSINLKLRVITPFDFSPFSLVNKEVHRNKTKEEFGSLLGWFKTPVSS